MTAFYVAQVKIKDQLKQHDFSVVMKLPNLDMLNEALDSESYQAIVPIRLAAADVTISVYQ